MALYNPASYFMCSNTPSDVSLLKHKAKLVGTSPSERKQDKSDESLVAQYHCPKFDKLIDPIVRVSQLYIFHTNSTCASHNYNNCFYLVSAIRRNTELLPVFNVPELDIYDFLNIGLHNHNSSVSLHS